MTIHATAYARRVQERRAHLYRIAYCYVKNQQDALDIVGEAVYRGLTRLRQLRDPAQLDAWLDRIVVHAALDHLRKQKHWQDMGEDALPDLPAEEKDLTPEDTMDLYAALDLLTPEERTYIILRFFEGCSFREMGEILEQPETTIKSRLTRILTRLRGQLTPKEGST